MKHLLLLSLLFTSTALAELSEDAVYRGKAVAADGQAWRSTVNLAYESAGGNWGGCSGTWIDDDVILTAAHCRVKNGGQLVVKMYKQNDKEQAEQIWLEGGDFHFTAHPRYVKSSSYDPGSDDIGVIVLKRERLPDGFSVAQFHTAGIRNAADPGRTAFAVGTGRNERGAQTDRILFAQGTISNYETGGVMVVSFQNGQGICGGDSGGPLFVQHGRELYLSAVITAVAANLGHGCGDRLYTNVITAERYNWIQARVRNVRGRFQNELDAEYAQERAAREAQRKAEEERLRREEEEAKKNAPAPQPAPAPAPAPQP